MDSTVMPEIIPMWVSGRSLPAAGEFGLTQLLRRF